jgi:hypothetical protein
MTATMRAEIEELARQIKKSDTWDMDQLAELCEAAGMAEEWKNADRYCRRFDFFVLVSDTSGRRKYIFV